MTESDRAASVKKKVTSIGMSRCDICESMRPECFEVAAGFFGSRAVYLCPRCLRTISEMVDAGETS